MAEHQCEYFYVQDGRQSSGNNIMWWRKDGCGYTDDLEQAHVFTREEVISRFGLHGEKWPDRRDIPWPACRIDAITIRVVRLNALAAVDRASL